jgi:hypothetical protein
MSPVEWSKSKSRLKYLKKTSPRNFLSVKFLHNNAKYYKKIQIFPAIFPSLKTLYI